MNKEKIIKLLNNPFSKHDLETLKFLNKLRSTNTKNKYCLVVYLVTKPNFISFFI